MNTLEKLSKSELDEFLKFPVYISLLAANHDGVTDAQEKKTAVELDHIKTYACDPLLADFYEKADKVFKSNLEQLDNELPKGKTERDDAIRAKLKNLEGLLLKFDKIYANAMHRSMQSFKDHVSGAHWNVLDNFLFPVPIKGINY